ncbi:MAG: START domain-containing protein [Pseudomonadota bacterium]
MERPSLLILVVALLQCAPFTTAAEPDSSWNWVAGREGIEVYSRDVESSPLDESLAITKFEASLTSVVALILDIDNNHRWIDSVDQSRVIERISDTESINYTVSNAPWPVSDRDAVVRTRVTQNPDTLAVLITSEALPEFIPQRQGLIRVEAIASSWRLLPLKGGGVEVRYQVHSDPGGNLPNWLVNAVMTDQPLNTLYGMHRELTRPPYSDAHLSFTREPASYLK